MNEKHLIKTPVMFNSNKIIILFFTLFALPLTAEEFSLDSFYGRYEISSVERYRGGLTTAEEAMQKVGKKMLFCSKKYTDSKVSIDMPVYSHFYESNNLPEGEVNNYKNSAFYGYLPERNQIDYIYVTKNNNTSSPIKLEIIDNDRLMMSFDGFFYKFTKIGNCK